ncbi:Dna2/Cas4 domain-containing protein [Candidatus Fermentibacteria bacterium]|nr:Dna2/Cas4 domain-containing protein [Candidatus Fermentibacteria bacterium]
MPLLKVLEGHYRSLEGSLVALLSEFAEDPSAVTAVVTTGRPLLERLQRILTHDAPVLAGCQFFPGLSRLAAKLARPVHRERGVSHADSALLVLRAIKQLPEGEPFSGLSGSIPAAHSLGRFFEKLLDLGIDSRAYNTTSMMLKTDPGPVARSVAELFEGYESARNRLYPRAADRLVDSYDGAGLPFDNLILYGFYDLNPGQRRFVRKLLSTSTDCYWFSPLSDASKWEELYRRTSELLGNHSSDRVRTDTLVSQGPFMDIAGAMLNDQKLPPPPEGLRVVSTEGETATVRAVLKRVSELCDSEFVPLEAIAVVGREETRRNVCRLAHHEGVPVAEKLSVPLSEFPLGELLAAVIEVEEKGYHYSALQTIVRTGCLNPSLSPDRETINGLVSASGVRSGLAAWKEAASNGKSLESFDSLLSALAELADDLPDTAAPSAFARLTARRVEGWLSDETPVALLNRMLSEDRFLSPVEVDRKGFAALLRLELSHDRVEIRRADPQGFHLLSPETARGTLFDAVLFTDLEEGVFPQLPREDPMLPPELRRKLQLPSETMGVREQGFMFLQSMEATARHADLVHMVMTSEGKECYPSMFIQPLSDHQGLEKVHVPGGPVESLLGGCHPGQTAARQALAKKPPLQRPFLYDALSAEFERISPAPLGVFDGVLGKGVVELPSRCSATALESYLRCPFKYLAERVWGLRERPSPGITSRLEPTVKGSLMHQALERALSRHGFSARLDEVRDVLRKVCEEAGVAQTMGNAALAERFVELHSRSLHAFMHSLASRKWKLKEVEQLREGRLGKLLLKGKIDLLFRGPEGLVVADFKSGKPKGTKKVANYVLTGKMFQLPFYFVLLAPEELPVLAGYLYLDQASDRQPMFEAGRVEEMLPAAAEAATRLDGLMKEGFFPPIAEKNVCYNCCFRELCRLTPEDRIKWKRENDSRVQRLEGESG